MRIAVNTRVLLKDRMEGVCRYIHETTKRMVLAHPEDEFIFFFDRPFHPSFVYADNVTPVVISPPTRDPILWKIWFDYSVPRALNKYKADVFLSGDTYASLRTEIPTVLVSHDIAYVHYPEHIPRRVLKYYQKHFPQFHKNAHHVIAVSEFTRQDVIDSYGIDERKVSVAHNSIPEGFHPFSESEKISVRNLHTGGKPFFIYVGSLHPRKNILHLIAAYEHYRRSKGDCKLLLLGRKAWNYDEIDAKITRSPYASDIIYLSGDVHDPRTILPAAEAMCYVSLHEGFGIPILEAMSAGVPVITSNVTSMPEVAGDAALLANPKDSMEIAAAMNRIMNEKELSVTLVKKGFEQLKKFSWDESAEKIYEILQSI